MGIASRRESLTSRRLVVGEYSMADSLIHCSTKTTTPEVNPIHISLGVWRGDSGPVSAPR
jgi:hypothetical protein